MKNLKQDGFTFPHACKLGLGLYVNLEHRYVKADHAFICIPQNDRLICLEKNGSRGPYVRIEFSSENDLGAYMSWSLLQDATNPKECDYGSAVLVSLNDRLVGVYRSGVAP